MQPKRLFLRWALLTSLMTVGTIIAWEVKAFHFVYTADASKITFVILGLFVLSTALCGRLTWRASKSIDLQNNQDPSDFAKTLQGLENDSSHVDTAMEVCTALGLLGTAIGIIMAFFSGDQFKGMENYDRLGSSVGTAIITTAAGLICAILLLLQNHNLRHALKKARIENGKGDE